MSLYANFFDRFVLPFFSPVVIAKSLQKKKPTDAAAVLQGMGTEKSLAVLSQWSPGVQTVILTQMGEKALPLIRRMEPKDQARLMISLPIKLVKKYSRDLSIEELSEMHPFWGDEDLRQIVLRLPPQLGASLFSLIGFQDQLNLLKDHKPWVQASLMEKLDEESRAQILDELDFKSCIDLFTRWDSKVQAKVLDSLSGVRRHEIIEVLSPKAVVGLMMNIDDERAKEMLIGLDDDMQKAVLAKLPLELQLLVFPIIANEIKVYLINGLQPIEATKLLDTIPKDEAEYILNQVDDDLASSIRMADLMR